MTCSVNSKTASYVAITGDTVIPTFVSNAIAAFQTSTIAEIAELTWESPSSGVILATGPTNGAPVTVTFGGTCTHSGTSGYPIAATSPYDLTDTGNYVGGTKPGNGDTLVIENSSLPILWNLDTYTANTVTIIRRGSHTGQLGLPDTNPAGYPEYRKTHLETAGTSLTIEDNGPSSFVRVKSTAGSAVTAYVTASQTGTVGQLYQEGVELTGMPASSIVNLNGGSLALAPLTAQTTTVATLRASNGSLRCGSGVTLTTANLNNVQADIGCTYTTLTLDRGSAVRVSRAAVGTTTTVENGTLTWASSGSGWGTLTVGSNGVVDASQAPAAIASTAITCEEGCQLLDPNERITKTYSITISGELANMTLDLGTRFTLAVS